MMAIQIPYLSAEEKAMSVAADTKASLLLPGDCLYYVLHFFRDIESPDNGWSGISGFPIPETFIPINETRLSERPDDSEVLSRIIQVLDSKLRPQEAFKIISMHDKSDNEAGAIGDRSFLLQRCKVDPSLYPCCWEPVR